jgi:hypothetical protein
MDLSGNGCPSPLGYSHFTNIHNRLPTNSWVDYPSDYSNQVVGDTNSITFVTMNSYPTFRIDVAGATNIFWHWGDGTTASNLTVASNDFGHAYVRTNYVRVLPREALTGLGAPNGDNGGGGQAYLTIFGLTNFPNLEALRLWNDGVKHLDITNCPALRHLYLAGNYEPQSETDNWFIALNDAVTNPVSNTVFFYNSPDDPVWWGQTNAPTQISDQARASLQDKNWNLQRWHQ